MFLQYIIRLPKIKKENFYMITEQKILDDLIMAAMQKGNDPAVTELSAGIRDCEFQLLKDAVENFQMLLQEWDDSVGASDEKSEICLFLAESSIMDTPVFRAALHDAARRLLPPYISSPAVAKSIGAKDSGIAVNSVASRIRKLQKLRTNAFVFQTESHCWGRLVNLDKVMATVSVSTFDSNMISIPIATALSGCLFFEQHIEMTNLISARPGTLRPSSWCREVLARRSIGHLSEEKIMDILSRTLVPNVLSASDFENWWNNTTSTVSKTGERSFRDARSILELHKLLTELPEGEKPSIDESAALKLGKLFSNVRNTGNAKDLALLAETISLLSESGSPEDLAKMYGGLRGKVPFFPAEITQKIDLKTLEIWGKLSAKYLPGFIQAAGILYSQLELAKLFLKLPAKCMNLMLGELTFDDIADAISSSQERPSCDMLMVIWKNKSKFPEELQEYLTMQNVSRALSEDNLPKEWAAAQRELKKLLFDKADFQKFLLANAGENVNSVIYPIQKMRNMAPGECQSLLVKLSRLSEALKNRIESGDGRKILAGGKEESAAKDTSIISSIASYRRLANELEDIIKVQIPENNKAIEVARSFGDFRENAEYDAAKERRRFLQHRRNELENQIGSMQTVDFTSLTPDLSKVALGTTVTLAYADGKKQEFYVVGAWDGNPDRNQISYKTKFGEILLGKKAGDDIVLPEGEVVKLETISSLPSDLQTELSKDE